VLLLRSLSTPRLLDEFERAIAAPFDWPPSDTQRAALTTFIEGTYRPDALLLYFGTHDAFQHTYGPGAAWTSASLRDIDRLLATILASLDTQKLLENTFVAVVSDHGFIEVEHAVAPNVALMQAGLMEMDSRGRIAAWQAYSHGEGGSSLVYVKDRSNQTVVARVRGVLDSLHADARAGIDRVLDHDELVAAGADPEAAFGLEMKPGYGITPDTHNLFQPPYIAAMHGYPPRRPEMNASFIITGPGMKDVGNVGTVRLTQIGPTLAHLLGLTLSSRADAPIDRIIRATR
jgi:predicted AlkP superfamily pyrophosphatase or phosphodiesterase